jgi:hydroxypyruvate reductase
VTLLGLDAVTLRAHPVGDVVVRVLEAAITAVDPEPLARAAVLDAVRDRDGDVIVAGGGKAGVKMARGIVAALGDRARGVVVVPAGTGAPDRVGGVRILEAAHPLPDERSVAAGQAVLDTVAGARARDLVVCPISGGGSALMCVPAPGVTLARIRERTATLLRDGTPIEAINAERARLDRLKAGGLARAAGGAQVLALVLSDVIDGEPTLVASGPTALEAAHVRHVVLASNDTAVQAAAAHARTEGCEVEVLPPLRGEARLCGVTLGRRIAEAPPTDAVRCTIAGGETTVTVHGRGRGGRNQELALAAAPQLLGLRHALLVAFATDGIDGPTDAAGAVIDGSTVPRALELGIDPATHLADNDAYRFFDALHDLCKPGPTGTNVCDLTVLIS